MVLDPMSSMIFDLVEIRNRDRVYNIAKDTHASVVFPDPAIFVMPILVSFQEQVIQFGGRYLPIP